MKKKFSTNRFFLNVGSLIGLLLVIIFASPLALNINSYKSDLESKLSATLNTNVRIEGDITYTFNLGPKLRFKNIIFDGGKDSALNGNIENFNLNINLFKLFKKEFSFEKFSIANGSLSVSEDFFKSYIQNKSQFEKITFKNIDLKIINNLSEIEFNNNSGTFLFNSKNLIASNLQGMFSNSLYNLEYKNSKLKFNIPELKLSLVYTSRNQTTQNNFIEIMFSEKFLFPGLRNTYIRSKVVFNNNKVTFDNAKISSSIYNGVGIIILKTDSNNLSLEADLKFGRPIFSKITSPEWVSFFTQELFQIASLTSGDFKINFQHVFFNQSYFDDLSLDVSFNGGDIVLNRIQFSSNKNSLDLSGRLVQENNESFLFFESSFKTKQLKKLCIRACKSKPKSNNYLMRAKGSLNLKKSKFTIDSFFSNNEYDQSQIAELNQNLKVIFFGDLSKTFEIKNYLKLY